jgi:hypothetical protein
MKGDPRWTFRMPSQLVLYSLAVVSVLAQSTHSWGQNIPSSTRLTSFTSDAAASEAASKFYDDLYSSRYVTTPRVILVPGILGSQIQECEPDKTGCKTIWGTTEALEKNTDATIKDNKTYKTDVVEWILFTDVYG